MRELSAKLTEGLIYHGIDILTNAAKISADFIVCDTNNRKTISLQKSSTLPIFFHIPILVVLGTIQLNDQFCVRTVKICNVFPRTFCLEKQTG